MAVGIHVVRIGLFTVDQNGNRIDKSSRNTTIDQLKDTSHAILVIPDASIGTSTGYPTVKNYLVAEATNNYVLNYMDQSFIITYNQHDVNVV